MAHFSIKKGRNLKILGGAKPDIKDLGTPSSIAVYPLEFKGIKPRVIVKEGDQVEQGQAIIEDKNDTGVVVVAPLGGKIQAINRGEKRSLINVVISVDAKASRVSHQVPDENADCAQWIEVLKASGLWTIIRQRPFSKILDSQVKPKSIFVKAVNTEPLALDLDVVLDGQDEVFQAGLRVLQKLTTGAIHLCYSNEAKSTTLLKAEGVEHHTFSGPHPSGNVSVFVKNIDPINKGEVIGFVDAQDVIRLGRFAQEGTFSSDKVFAVVGEGVDDSKRTYVKSTVGVALVELLQDAKKSEVHVYLSGSVLTGYPVGYEGYARFYHSQIHVLPNEPQRKLLRFFRAGVDEYTFSKTYVGAFLGKQNQESSLDSSINGSDRAIIINDIYDKYIPLDIYTYFLLKAIFAGEWDEAENLGLLECDPEDFALASFACPSKTDIVGIISHGLEVIEREG